MENQDQKNVAVNISASAIEELAGKPLVIEQHITEHNAPTLNEKVSFSRHVTLGSIAEWIGKRNFPSAVKENVAQITFCLHPNNPSIRFEENPNDELATVLTSKLTINPDYVAFGINKGQYFSQKELLSFVKQHAHCFQSLADVKTLIAKLQNFEARFTQTVVKRNDNQGNAQDSITTAIQQHEGEVSGVVALRMPLYLGLKPVSFTAEIEIQKGQNNLPVFSFNSLDVQMLVLETAENAILEEVAKFKDQFVCLQIEK